MRRILLIVALAALTGCASQEYAMYAETQRKIAEAQAMSDTAKYAALAEIARQGDTAAKVAAVISINMMGNGSSVASRTPQIVAPESIGDKALKWTGVLLPSLTQFYSISANRQIAVTQSNNQAAIAQSTNNTFATMNGNMATSNTAIANAGFTAATTIANSGLTAVTTTAANGLTATQNVATAGINGVVTTGANGLTAATNINAASNTAITNVSNAANTSIQTLSNQIPNLQPNITTTTSNTTTTNNNLTCPTGTTLVNGSCQ